VPKRCVFCERPGKTIEHLFSGAWLQRVMPSEGPYSYNLRKYDNGAFESASFTKSKPEISVRGLCEHCNNGWSQQLDSALEPLLTTLLRGQRRVLRDDLEVTALARWVCKVACVADSMQPGEPALARAHGAHVKDHADPPTSWRIWMAHTAPIEQHRAWVQPMTLLRPSGRGYCFTTVLDRLVMQALVLPAEEQHLKHPLERHLVPLWPNPAGPFVFPPPTPLTDAEIQQLAHVAGDRPVTSEAPPPPVPL
jgi:hypothetical protein